MTTWAEYFNNSIQMTTLLPLQKQTAHRPYSLSTLVMNHTTKRFINGKTSGKDGISLDVMKSGKTTDLLHKNFTSLAQAVPGPIQPS